MTPPELRELVEGSRAIHQALGGHKEILPEEQPTIDFAYASVVAIRDIDAGETIDESCIWVKRPGTGEIPAKHFDEVLGQTATRRIAKNEQLRWSDFGGT
jgi:N-acetylneuraminate synthase